MQGFEVITLGDITITFVLSRKQTGGLLDAFEVTLPAQRKMIIPHCHPGCDETVIGLNGTTSWIISGKKCELREGEKLYIPRGAEHGFFNPSKQTARFLCIMTPGMLGMDYFREIAFVMEGDAPVDFEDVASIMRRYGVIPTAPDLPVPSNATGVD
jgi:quercetin dioxygenase-like cupin family protein